MNENIRKLIFQTIDETISPEDFARLQDSMEQSDEVRQEYLRAIHLSESLSEIAADSSRQNSSRMADVPAPADVGGSKNRRWVSWRFSAAQLAIAATVLMLVGGAAYWFGQHESIRRLMSVASQEIGEQQDSESRIAGHATLRRVVDLRWPSSAVSYREGDVLPNGRLQFEAGVAELDFFCGASLIVEGPAILEIESDWSLRVVEGRLRANVPPAARGFVVKAADSEIVDLGTEFALEVGANNARVEVLDGEVELRGGDHDGERLVTGQRQSLTGTTNLSQAIEGLSTVSELLRRRNDAEAQRFVDWQAFSMQLAQDKRLIAYFPISVTAEGRVVRNAASTGSDRDGQIVGPVERTAGRFGADSAGLEFGRPAARVRTRIDGEYEAFTFVCWARIDSLEHRYNALFMGDGYENGEPHWQIRDDGSLMFSVMVDDTQIVRHYSDIEQRIVTQAGLHRVYYTEPFWDISQSGQWFHLAAVYDPNGRRVQQYVNGKQVSDDEIIDKFSIEKLRIGAAEIGNWGRPFRKSPSFAVRNLNGTIDELAIFNAVLTEAEIHAIYEQGKPLGY